MTYTITVEDKQCVVKAPDRNVLEIFLSKCYPTINKPDYIGAGEVILKSCWESGDKEILENEDYLIGAALQAQKTFDVQPGDISIEKDGSAIITIGDKSCKLKKPNREVLSEVLGDLYSANNEPLYITTGEYILTKCWKSGDKEILEDEAYLISAAMQAYKLIKIKQGEIKKN